MNVEIMIRFKSKDMYGEIFEKKYKCVKLEKDKIKKYCYYDGDTQNNLEISKNKIFIERKGEVNSTLSLKEFEKSKLEYDSSYLKKTFDVKCTYISATEEGVSFIYEIYDNNEIINKLEIEIREER